MHGRILKQWLMAMVAQPVSGEEDVGSAHSTAPSTPQQSPRSGNAAAEPCPICMAPLVVCDSATSGGSIHHHHAPCALTASLTITKISSTLASLRVVLPCKHAFHMSCLWSWFASKLPEVPSNNNNDERTPTTTTKYNVIEPLHATLSWPTFSCPSCRHYCNTELKAFIDHQVSTLQSLATLSKSGVALNAVTTSSTPIETTHRVVPFTMVAHHPMMADALSLSGDRNDKRAHARIASELWRSQTSLSSSSVPPTTNNAPSHVTNSLLALSTLSVSMLNDDNDYTDKVTKPSSDTTRLLQTQESTTTPHPSKQSKPQIARFDDDYEAPVPLKKVSCQQQSSSSDSRCSATAIVDRSVHERQLTLSLPFLQLQLGEASASGPGGILSAIAAAGIVPPPAIHPLPSPCNDLPKLLKDAAVDRHRDLAEVIPVVKMLQMSTGSTDSDKVMSCDVATHSPLPPSSPLKSKDKGSDALESTSSPSHCVSTTIPRPAAEWERLRYEACVNYIIRIAWSDAVAAATFSPPLPSPPTLQTSTMAHLVDFLQATTHRP